MKLAIIQMDIAYGEPQKNFTAVERYITEAAKGQPDVIVLPEMWNTGYALKQLAALADKNGASTIALLSKLAKKFAVNIVAGSVATNKAGQFFNTMYVFNRAGQLVGEYDKVHLFKLMDEHLYMEAGKAKNLFTLDDTLSGGVICYDLRFPEWIRAHVLAGAKVIFIPAEWPKARIDHWRLLLQARAIENQCFICAVNRVGADPNNEFNGQSMVIAPWGDILLTTENAEGIFSVEIDLTSIQQVRETIPIFTDRRTDLY